MTYVDQLAPRQTTIQAQDARVVVSLELSPSG
jgi:hypothetical protein